jgi:hypothetical protein
MYSLGDEIVFSFFHHGISSLYFGFPAHHEIGCFSLSLGLVINPYLMNRCTTRHSYCTHYLAQWIHNKVKQIKEKLGKENVGSNHHNSNRLYKGQEPLRIIGLQNIEIEKYRNLMDCMCKTLDYKTALKVI